MKVKIEKLDHFGRGITYINDKICFVLNALPLEIVELKIIKETKKYYLGIATDYIELSPDRIIEKCPYYNICGGCQLEHLNYQKENEYKQKKVLELVRQFSKLEVNVLDIEYQEPSFYRNKVTLHGANHKLGYYKPETNELIEISSCRLLDSKINNIIPKLQELAQNKNNEIEEIIIRTDNQSEKLMININGKIDDVSSLREVDVLSINNKVITKEKQIISKIGPKKYYLSINSFFQVNKTLTEKLYNEIKKIVQEKKPNTVLDLYCGAGTIGIYISEYANKVIGIDCLPSNIIDANKNKELNNIFNISFIEAKVANIIDQFSKNIDLIIVDPPRAGLDKKTLIHIKRINPETIIYVSCDPATLARDLKELALNYTVEYIKPFNMFPRTYHVECVSVLHRKSLEK